MGTVATTTCAAAVVVASSSVTFLNMAEADWDFVFDGVVGFLTSPMWQLPVMNFVEKNCIVFDPSEENCLPWADIHRDYKILVEDLLSSYLKDVGINEEQFVQACGTPSLQSRPQMQAVFEQIWAAEDFEIFKRMMVQRNIELELQALELINQQQEKKRKSTANKQQQEERDGGIEPYEDKILKEVIRKSKEEYDALVKENKKEADEIEKHYSESHDTNVKILRDKAEEKRQEMKRVVADRLKSSNETEQFDSAPASKEERSQADNIVSSTVTVQPPLSSVAGESISSSDKTLTAADAATSWLVCAKAEAANEMKLQPSLSSLSTTAAEKEDLKRREQYLKEQRDRLLRMKNKEREKQLDTYAASQPKRPTSARTARKAVAIGDTDQVKPASEQADTKRLAVRKALADKLKKEIIYK